MGGKNGERNRFQCAALFSLLSFCYTQPKGSGKHSADISLEIIRDPRLFYGTSDTQL